MPFPDVVVESTALERCNTVVPWCIQGSESYAPIIERQAMTFVSRGRHNKE